MPLSGETRQGLTLSINEDPIDVAVNNIAVARNSSDDQESENNTSSSHGDVTTPLLIQTKAHYSSPNLTNASGCVLQQLRDDVQYHVSPYLSSPAKVSSSINPFQPYRFLAMPTEIRLKIYELVVSQRVHIESDLENIIASTIIPCSDHSSAGCLPKISHHSPSNHPKTHCQGTVLFSHMLCASYEASRANRQSTTVSRDMQTGKQQVAINNVISNDQSALCQDRATCASRMQDLRLLRTCRQIYDEARSVLYHSNTFVFLGFATFAAYFGITAPNQAYTPRSTEPNRLRAIQAMTKVEIHGHVDVEFMDFLSATRLIRTGLGCLTSLVSLELNLDLCYYRDEISHWKIDDCMFSKPSSLRKLVIDVQNLNTRVESEELVTELDKLEAAEELMRRMLKQEGFRDRTEDFWGYDGPAAVKATDSKVAASKTADEQIEVSSDWED